MLPTTEQVKIDIKLNVEKVRKMRPHIAIPCYGGMCTEKTMLSLIKWANLARELNIDWTIETMINESLISRARNVLTAKFLCDQTTATHLLFIDADIGFEPWHILALMDRDVDVIGGLYPLKSLPLRWCVNAIEGVGEKDGMQEVSKTGTGFMLIKRGVFDRAKNHPSVKSFNNDTGLDLKYDAFLKTYFDTAVRENRYYSEDWTFCENWRDMGGSIFVDKRVLLEHVGTMAFSAQGNATIQEVYGAQYVATLKQLGYNIVDKDGNIVQTT